MKSFQEQHNDLIKEVAGKLCQIENTAHFLPHMVFVEEVDDDGAPEYNKYQLVDIRNDGGCSLIDCNGIRIDDQYSLTDINLEWLITIWNWHIEQLNESAGVQKSTQMPDQGKKLTMPELVERVVRLGTDGGFIDVTGTWRGKSRTIRIEQTEFRETPVCLIGGYGNEVSSLHPSDVPRILDCVLGNYLDCETYTVSQSEYEEIFKEISFPEFLEMVDNLSLGESFEFACHHDIDEGTYAGHWGIKKCSEFDADYILMTLCGGGVLFAVDISDRHQEDVYEELYLNLKEFIDDGDGESYKDCKGVLYHYLNPC